MDPELSIMKKSATGSRSPCIALETHEDFIRSDDVLRLLHEFSPDEVGVVWDTEHTFRKDEEPKDTANALRRFVRHVHVKDSTRVDGKNVPQLMGEGELPIAKFVEALQGIEYDGWLCLETEKRWHPQADPAVVADSLHGPNGLAQRQIAFAQ